MISFEIKQGKFFTESSVETVSYLIENPQESDQQDIPDKFYILEQNSFYAYHKLGQAWYRARLQHDKPALIWQTLLFNPKRAYFAICDEDELKEVQAQTLNETQILNTLLEQRNLFLKTQAREEAEHKAQVQFKHEASTQEQRYKGKLTCPTVQFHLRAILAQTVTVPSPEEDPHHEFYNLVSRALKSNLNEEIPAQISDLSLQRQEDFILMRDILHPYNLSLLNFTHLQEDPLTLGEIQDYMLWVLTGQEGLSNLTEQVASTRLKELSPQQSLYATRGRAPYYELFVSIFSFWFADTQLEILSYYRIFSLQEWSLVLDQFTEGKISSGQGPNLEADLQFCIKKYKPDYQFNTDQYLGFKLRLCKMANKYITQISEGLKKTPIAMNAAVLRSASPEANRALIAKEHFTGERWYYLGSALSTLPQEQWDLQLSIRLNLFIRTTTDIVRFIRNIPIHQWPKLAAVPGFMDDFALKVANENKDSHLGIIEALGLLPEVNHLLSFVEIFNVEAMLKNACVRDLLEYLRLFPSGYHYPSSFVTHIDIVFYHSFDNEFTDGEIKDLFALLRSIFNKDQLSTFMRGATFFYQVIYRNRLLSFYPWIDINTMSHFLNYCNPKWLYDSISGPVQFANMAHYLKHSVDFLEAILTKRPMIDKIANINFSTITMVKCLLRLDGHYRRKFIAVMGWEKTQPLILAQALDLLAKTINETNRLNQLITDPMKLSESLSLFFATQYTNSPHKDLFLRSVSDLQSLMSFIHLYQNLSPKMQDLLLSLPELEGCLSLAKEDLESINLIANEFQKMTEEVLSRLMFAVGKTKQLMDYLDYFGHTIIVNLGSYLEDFILQHDQYLGVHSYLEDNAALILKSLLNYDSGDDPDERMRIRVRNEYTLGQNFMTDYLYARLNSAETLMAVLISQADDKGVYAYLANNNNLLYAYQRMISSCSGDLIIGYLENHHGSVEDTRKIHTVTQAAHQAVQDRLGLWTRLSPPPKTAVERFLNLLEKRLNYEGASRCTLM